MSTPVTRAFSAATRAALFRKGVVVLSTVAIPGDGPMPWANASTGFNVDDNGTHRVLTHAQVLERAK